MKIPKAIIFLALTFFFLFGEGSLVFSGDKVIVGNYLPDWVYPDSIGNGLIRDNSSAIGRLIMPVKGTACTAFLISEEVAMTNQHCIRSEADVVGAHILFNYEKGKEREKFICDEFISNNEDLDYALLRCKKSPGTIYGFVKLSEHPPIEDTKIYLVHQNCDYYEDKTCIRHKIISHGILTDISDIKIYHNADTLGGSSGSPIFSADTHEVIGIHNKGSGHEEIDGRRNGRGKMNLGIKMSQIVAEVKTILPNIF